MSAAPPSIDASSAGHQIDAGGPALPPGAPAWMQAIEPPVGMTAMDVYALWSNVVTRTREVIVAQGRQDEQRFGPLDAPQPQHVKPHWVMA